MVFITRLIIYLAMTLLGVVSMWTTYVSVRDSILPEPVVRLNLGQGVVWDCSIIALGLSVAIGLMLFALKVAIIDEQKRLNILGLIGLTVVGFISISFNLDVLYRTADRDFFVRYSSEKMRAVYEDYLREAQTILLAKEEKAKKDIARQKGELAAEIKGLRKAPEGYGPIAKEEDYKLTVLQETAAVDLENITMALAKKDEADTLLKTTHPVKIEEVDELQNRLRVAIKDIGAHAGLPLPAVVKIESPLFAVFAKVFDFNTIGIKEIFFLVVAFFLDLGDIIGYSLIPNKPKKKKEEPLPDFTEPERMFRARLQDESAEIPRLELAIEPQPAPEADPPTENLPAAAPEPRRPFGFRRK